MLTNTILAADNCIRFNGKDFKQEYNVDLSFIENEETNYTISYKTNVHYTKTFNLPYYLVEVVKNNFLVNFNEPDTVLETFFLQCAAALSRCIFRVAENNAILDLDNHEQIIEKWETIKVELAEDTTGDFLENEIAKFDAKIKDKSLLLSKLKKDIFIHHYFFPLFEMPYHGFEKKGVEYFSFFNNDYKESVLLSIENEGIFDKNKQAIVTKKLFQKQIEDQNDTENEIIDLTLDIEFYQTKYLFNTTNHIFNIEGKFVNQGKQCTYTILGK